MRILGQRADGAFHLSIGAGLSVILRGDRASRATHPEVIERMGPWRPASNELAERRRVNAKLELARYAALESFALPTRPYTPDQAKHYYALVHDSPSIQTLAASGEHPFTYCKEHVIPAMAKDGKEPDDPDAFCSWWKHEGPGAE